MPVGLRRKTDRRRARIQLLFVWWRQATPVYSSNRDCVRLALTHSGKAPIYNDLAFGLLIALSEGALP